MADLGWTQYVAPECLNWNDPKTLIRLRRDEEKAVSSFVDSFASIAEAASPIIDEADRA